MYTEKQLQEFYDILIPWIENSPFWNKKCQRFYPRGLKKYEYTENYKLFSELKKYFDFDKNSCLYWMMKRNLFKKPLCIICNKEIKNVLPKPATKDQFYDTCSIRCTQLKPEVRQKITQTNLKKYGTKTATESKEIKEKIKNNNLKKYGVVSTAQIPEIREKQKQTCLERYGVEHISQIEGFNEKYKETLIKKHGSLEEAYKKRDENYKKSLINNHGSLEEAYKKRDKKTRKTNLEKYGVEYYFQTNTSKNNNKLKNDIIQEKRYITKKKNGTFNSSKQEDKIYDLLSRKFEKVERQYRSEVYPYSCDFYIPELNLYIEYQGTWTHGEKPFDPENIEHQKIVEEWKEKAEEINFKGENKYMYHAAIEVWTTYDPLKREIAKENNLNWIEFFNIIDFTILSKKDCIPLGCNMNWVLKLFKCSRKYCLNCLVPKGLRDFKLVEILDLFVEVSSM